MTQRKPQQIGTVWTASAKLYVNGRLVAKCVDTPNAIAKALMELPQVEMVKSLVGYKSRSEYADRMAEWNVAKSGLVQV